MALVLSIRVLRLAVLVNAAITQTIAEEECVEKDREPGQEFLLTQR